MSVMTRPDAPVLRHDHLRLRPQVQIRPPNEAERKDAGPWAISSGNDSCEIAVFADGGNKHAPELIAALRRIFAADVMPALLIYAHRGQKVESMMPLLPSLMHAIDYRGPCCAIRIAPGQDDAAATGTIRRFAAGQMPDDGFAVLVDDRQERIARTGGLRPASIDISFLETAASHDARMRFANKFYI